MSGAIRNVEARYSNYLDVGQNAFEFLLEFGQHQEGEPEPHIHTRIVTTPFFAKQFSELLHASIHRYERDNGAIDVRKGAD